MAAAPQPEEAVTCGGKRKRGFSLAGNGSDAINPAYLFDTLYL